MSNQSNKSALLRIQDWYASQCNGDWEHTYGISIDNVDNPGWSLAIDLADTELEGEEFKKLTIQRQDNDDWVHCWVEDKRFVGHCGPNNLQELITVFVDWADKQK
ncbi:MAG: immunity 53 family protein [Pseudomonadota bacterium]